jgi:hypothetical protein
MYGYWGCGDCCLQSIKLFFMDKLTVEQIESILFEPIGLNNIPYHLKLVEIHSPMQNVSHCIMINGNYYREVPIETMAVKMDRTLRAGREPESFWDGLLRPFR